MSEKVTLINEGKILSNDAEVVECFSSYSTNITNSLTIDPAFREILSDYLKTEQEISLKNKSSYQLSILPC